MTARQYSRAAARLTKATPVKRTARALEYCASRQVPTWLAKDLWDRPLAVPDSGTIYNFASQLGG